MWPFVRFFSPPRARRPIHVFRGKLSTPPVANAWVTLDVPAAISRTLGTRGRVYVKGTLAGAAVRSTLIPNGEGTHCLHVSRPMLAAAKAAPGEVVDVAFETATKPSLRIPPALTSAIKKSAKANAYWATLPPSHKKAYVEFVTEAKKDETRARRVKQSVARLAQGQRRD